MAQEPVVTAASGNPLLSTLVAAVRKAGLTDTLNMASDITVFAPSDAAFAKLPKVTLDKLLADRKVLRAILTYHVVGSRKAPEDLVNGTFTTLQGGELTTSGSGESYKVNGGANVICGDIQTRNATVYIVDAVLMPKV
ncbi:fasciclin domain-containing protein [Sphaerisporangium corydalis]|uniref:Fasciclin domain-containing protein n=1 Tax=Sphaerisporangium corydalis TaxID=1441875 RepID=A0ABV9ESQ8_9ACTN|nr:fasciclin domain-containing protein [Sphaerisporangium corydalis]